MIATRNGQLQRTVFETPRAAEYFNAKELQAQTGQPMSRFADVVLKELVDNALDAAETAGRPPQIDIACHLGEYSIRIAVTDNGDGIAPETVERILNFDTRTSDKAAYRAPTRGLQGNAFKTIIGIPTALNGKVPVVVEACGIRHTIRAWIDPAGALSKEHDTAAIAHNAGTTVTVSLPSSEQYQFDPREWVRGFALLNPHAVVKIAVSGNGSELANESNAEAVDFYHSVASDSWEKFRPSDPTSPHWYDEATLKSLVYHEIAHARNGGKDKPLREFVREFRGLSSTAKAKAVCAQVAEIRKLSDFDGCDDAITRLLNVMREQSTEPKPAVLGLVGEPNLRTRLEAWHETIDGTFVYAKRLGMDLGLPFAVEVAAVMVEGGDAVEPYIGVNFSRPFSDPFEGVGLSSDKITGQGIRGFLTSAYVVPTHYRAAVPSAVVVHVTAPGLTFLDRAKSRVSLRYNSALKRALSEALWTATKHIYREGERQRKDASRVDRAMDRAYRVVRITQKDAVFQALPAAYEEATNGYTMRVSARDLYYTVRPKVLPLLPKSELGYGYFSQDLLTEYQQLYKRLELLYYEARGVLYMPHTGEEIHLGTREVENHELPKWSFDKILYIEKQGVWEALKESGMAERYDMAVISAKGYATEAARLLISGAEKGREYRIFAFHDADLSGHNIARTLAEETKRMPGYSVEIHDIGLKLQEAIEEMHLETESFTWPKNPPAKVVARLTDFERDVFKRRHQRVELNAILPADRVGYIERKLEEAGATDKVVPSDAVLSDQARGAYETEMNRRVDAIVNDLLDVDTIKRAMRDEFTDVMLTDPRGAVLAAFEETLEQSWRNAITDHTQTSVNEHEAQLRDSIANRIVTTLQR